MKEQLEILQQAIDVAMRKGAYTYEENKIIIQALEQIKQQEEQLKQQNKK